MVERIAGCIEAVTKQITQSSVVVTRSRRQLNPHFWVGSPHGQKASVTWTIVAELGRISRQQNHRKRFHNAVGLDFLHPPPSQTGIQHCQRYRARRFLTSRIQRRRWRHDQSASPAAHRSSSCGVVRSSTAKNRHLLTAAELRPDASLSQLNTDPTLQSQHTREGSRDVKSKEESRKFRDAENYQTAESMFANAETFENAEDTLSSESHQSYDFSADMANPSADAANTADSLRELLNHRYLGSHEKVWALFSRLEDPSKFRSSVLAYLATVDDEATLLHAINTYDAIESEARSEDDYRHGVMAAVRLRNERENEILDDAVARGRATSCSPFLLLHWATHKQWDRVAKLWHTISTTFAVGVLHRQSWWEDFNQSKDLVFCVLSLKAYIIGKEKLPSLQDSPLMDFTERLAGRAFLSQTTLRNTTGDGLLSVIEAIHDLSLLKPSHLFSGISTLKALQGSRLRTQSAFLLYNKYRDIFPQEPPPRATLGSMIEILTDPENAVPEYMQMILNDFTKFYRHPDERAFQRAMTAFARMGEVDHVRDLHNQYSMHYGRPKDLALLTPLLYVHAIVGDVERTTWQFDRLSQEYGIQPSLYCWNILLLAYGRRKDVQGAFGTFSAIQESGHRPNSYSFATIMGLCANIGDTDAIHHFVNLAREQGIKGHAAMIDTLVQSYCLDENPQGAQDLLEMTNEIQLDRPMTRGWNILLRHYAFNIDTRAVARVQERMKELGILPDRMTYAALMQSLVLIGRTLDAAKILQTLHLTRRMDATLFHYTILINGFAHEGNRKMVDVVYQEALDRFPQMSQGVALAKLQSLVARDISNTRQNQTPSNQIDLPHAEEFLHGMLNDVDRKALATKSPQPGTSFRRSSSVMSYPAAYFRFIASAYNYYGQTFKFQRLLKLYRSFAIRMMGDMPQSLSAMPLELTTEHMKMLLSQGKFAELTECWDQAVLQAIESGRQIHSDIIARTLGSKMVSQSKMSPPKPSYPDSEEHENYFATRNVHGRLHEPGLRILPAHRFLLANPLQIYMRALFVQRRESAVIDLIAALEKAGFALSSKNINTYVQFLTRSSKDDFQLLAFKVFENRLTNNIHKFSTTPEEAKRYQRIAKFNRGYLVPDYRTMKFLGNIMRKFQAQTLSDGGAAWDRLANSAPKTMRFLLVTSRTRRLRRSGIARARARAFRIMMHPKLTRRKVSGSFIGRFRRGQFAQNPNHSAIRSPQKDLQRMRGILDGTRPETRETAARIADAKRAKLSLVLTEAKHVKRFVNVAKVLKDAILPEHVSITERPTYRRRGVGKVSLRQKAALKGFRTHSHKTLSRAQLVSFVQGHDQRQATINQKTGDPVFQISKASESNDDGGLAESSKTSANRPARPGGPEEPDKSMRPKRLKRPKEPRKLMKAKKP